LSEAVAVEFTITCPIDGQIEVSLEDIDTVVLREPERADITFVCPHCGTEITVTAVVPSFLLAAIEALADDPDSASVTGVVVLSGDDAEAVETVSIDADDGMVEAYCEYFRRQLSHVECVEDALEEIDAKG